MLISFSRNLIRGKIAETVFEQMMRLENKYTIIPFGYEHTVPTLAQYQDQARIREVMDKISDAPDFIAISKDKKLIYLIEVKYQTKLDQGKLVKYADKLLKRWNPAWIFVATPHGFYCSECSSIIKTSQINKLSEKWASKERQNVYLNLLNEFKK